MHYLYTKNPMCSRKCCICLSPPPHAYNCGTLSCGTFSRVSTDEVERRVQQKNQSDRVARDAEAARSFQGKAPKAAAAARLPQAKPKVGMRWSCYGDATYG